MIGKLLVAGLAAGGILGIATPALADLTVDKAKVEEQVSTQLAAVTGQTPQKVTCPEDLKGVVGTQMTCRLTADDGSALSVSVTVTSVNGLTVNFDIKADTVVTPGPSPAATPSPATVPG